MSNLEHRLYNKDFMRSAGSMSTIWKFAAALTIAVLLVFITIRCNLTFMPIQARSGRFEKLPPYVHRCNFIHPKQMMLAKDKRGSEDVEGLGLEMSVLQTSLNMPIPRNLWQTHRTNKGVTTMVACAYKSWSRWNPSWSHFFLDDDDMYTVMARHYDADFIDKFKELPLGVMRADFFRCVCIHPLQSASFPGLLVLIK